jgi:hypothetical protein
MDNNENISIPTLSDKFDALESRAIPFRQESHVSNAAEYPESPFQAISRTNHITASAL